MFAYIKVYAPLCALKALIRNTEAEYRLGLSLRLKGIPISHSPQIARDCAMRVVCYKSLPNTHTHPHLPMRTVYTRCF